MGLEVVAEREERLRLVPPDDAANQSVTPERPTAPLSPAMLQMIQVLSATVAARSVLLLGGAGAFILFLIAVLMPSVGAITAATLYAAFVLVPIVAFALRKG